MHVCLVGRCIDSAWHLVDAQQIFVERNVFVSHVGFCFFLIYVGDDLSCRCLESFLNHF